MHSAFYPIWTKNEREILLSVKLRAKGRLRAALSAMWIELRPQPTRRTSWKLVANPGWQPKFPTSFQLVRLVGCGLYGVEYYIHYFFPHFWFNAITHSCRWDCGWV